MNDSVAGSWLVQIEGAHSAGDLARLLRAYVASLPSEQQAALPRGCTPEAISGAPEIQDWAVTLAQADLKLGGSTALHEAAVIFAAAGARLPKLGE
jgi:hypothetical protein